MTTSRQSIVVRAPSRLHFGMLSFGRPDVRQFGGVGAMVESPGLVLRVSRAGSFQANGPLAERLRATAERFAKLAGLPALPPFRLELESAPPEHNGLGVGTTVSLAVVYGLRRALELPKLAAGELAKQAGRGRRSAVGSYGFLSGGLIAEAGKLPGESLAPLLARVEIPAAWRFVLIGGQAPTGVSGAKERQAFASLPPVEQDVTEQLSRELQQEMIPALQAANFEQFSRSLYRYGHLAGNCFAPAQGGPFAHPNLDRLVTTIRELGVTGVGQTSWGPTLFALLEDETKAQEFREQIASIAEIRPEQMTIAAPNNRGVQVEGETYEQV